MPETIKIVDLDIDEKELLKKLTKLQEEITGLKTETKKLETANKELDKEGKKNTQQYKDNSAQIEKNKIQTKGLSTEYRSNQNTLVALNATEMKQLGTLQKLELSNKKLREESKTLDLTREDGRKRLGEINTQLDQNNKTILDNADATKAQKMNIGAYGSQLQGLGGPLAGATRGVGMLNAAFKLLIANPIGLILAAIALAIKAIGDAISKNQGMLDRFKAIGDGLRASYDVLLDRINAIGKAIKALGKLNFKTIKEGFKGIGKEIVEEFKAARQLREELQALEDQEIGDIVRKSELKQEVELLRLATKDSTITEKERLELLDQAIAVEEELLDIELDHARERARISQEQIDLGDSTRKEIEENARLQANLIDVETASIKRRRTLAAERLGITRKVAAEELAIVKQLVADTLAEFDKIESPFLKALESDEANLERYLEENNMMLDEIVADWDAAQKKITDSLDGEIEKRTEAEVDAFNIKRDLDDLEEDRNKKALAAGQDFLGNLITIFGEESKVGKAAAIADTTINAIKGAQAAYTSLSVIPIIGVPLGIAAAAAALEVGRRNINKIRAVQIPGGGGGGGGGMPSGGGIQMPSRNAPTDGGLSTQGIAKRAAALTKKDLEEVMLKVPPVLVVEEVTVKQDSKTGASKVITI